MGHSFARPSTPFITQTIIVPKTEHRHARGLPLRVKRTQAVVGALGGFKRSSQRVVCLHIVLAYQALRLAFSSQVSCVVSD
jgi:hypothetical protein